MERDEKGRFVKGNTEGQKIGSIGGLSAKEAQLRGAAKRKENRTLAEVVRRALEKKASSGSEMTRMEYLAEKAISNHATGSMTFKDLRELQRILGEDVQTINLGNGLNLTINSTEQGKDNIEKLMQG